MRKFFISVALIVITALTPLSGREKNIELPDIGDPAANVLPLSKEKRLGRIFVRQLRHQLPLIKDMELNEYINAIGTQLLTAGSSNKLPFHFLLVNDSQVNAFATLGGVIAINSGLLWIAENETELAGVLAHEITHVTQRHLARLLAQSKNDRWMNALALLSVILATVYNPSLGTVGLHAGLSIPIEKQLKYIRNHEHEADRIGMKLMVAANFNPAGMVNFFTRLQSMKQSVSNTPEFLRTHPLTSERRSQALNQLASYSGEYRENSWEFMYAKARLLALQSPHAVLREIFSNKPLDQYRRAIALTQLNRADEAATILESLTTDTRKLPIQLALTQTKIMSGDYAAAESIMKNLYALYPTREIIIYYYALAAFKNKKLDLATSILSTMTTKQTIYPDINLLYAQIALKQSKPWLRHEYMADYYEAVGNTTAALKQLDIAKKSKKGGSVFHSRIEAKHKFIEHLEKEMHDPLEN